MLYPDPASARRNAASLLTLWDSVGLRAACADRRPPASTITGVRRASPPPRRSWRHPRPHTLAVFGAGKIAPAAIRYLVSVRPFRHGLIVGRLAGCPAILIDQIRPHRRATQPRRLFPYREHARPSH